MTRRNGYLGRLVLSLLAIGVTTALVQADTASTAAAASLGERLADGGRVVCFGDSVTGVYYHTGGRRAYTDMLGIALGKIYPNVDITMINAGISGHTTVNALARIDRDVIAQRPDLVTVMFGLNDMTRVSLDQYRENLRAIVTKCRAAGAEVLLCTPNNVVDTPGRPTAKLIEYCNAVRDVGRDLQVPVCDCYAAWDALRSEDPLAWRLLMSDAIHPNMDGHKRIAELMAQSIGGQSVSLADVTPLEPAIPATIAKVHAGQTLKVLAMPPADRWVKTALEAWQADVRLEILLWPVADKTLAEIEQDAKARVRALKPDLVIIAVPRVAEFAADEAFIHSYAWIMNWSLSFANQQWDCLVVHPDVVDPRRSDSEQDAIIRQLVRAQDLKLIDRRAGDDRSGAEIFREAMTVRR